MFKKFMDTIKGVFGTKYTPKTPIESKSTNVINPTSEQSNKSESAKKTKNNPEIKKITSQGSMWSPEEIALFDKGLSNIEISKKTGRSLEAVKRKRSRLKK